jgi:hypothetical protein
MSRPSLVKTSPSPASPWLIFDVHGGGFIAQTSKTHCGYLFPLAIKTNVPVVCVNYSLAPQMQYPAQLHQVAFRASAVVPSLLDTFFFFFRYYLRIFGRARTARRWAGRERGFAF